MDYQKAFDKVPHNRLVSKLKAWEISFYVFHILILFYILVDIRDLLFSPFLLTLVELNLAVYCFCLNFVKFEVRKQKKVQF